MDHEGFEFHPPKTGDSPLDKKSTRHVPWGQD